MQPSNNVLCTDFYQLTMAQAYFELQKHEQEACFQMFIRKGPFEEPGVLISGIHDFITFCEAFQFSEEQLAYLGTLKDPLGKNYFKKSFLDYLRDSHFSCDIDAVPEGNYVFPLTPIIKIKGPIWQCQLLETPLLNIVNFSSLIATKAMRICDAADGDPVLDFGMRRAHGPTAALMASRSSYIGGCDASSNVEAGMHYQIPVKGTLSHAWVMSFSTEEEAFEVYASVYPDNCILLIDTYDSLEGVQNAIKLAKRLKAEGKKLLGVRLDSGDLLSLSKAVRFELDKHDFYDVKIFASNEIDETIITELKMAKAPIDGWGVGTRLVTAYPEGSLGGVYKLAALKNKEGSWDTKSKISNQEEKRSLAGEWNIYRCWKGDCWQGDRMVLANHQQEQEASLDLQEENLLKPLFQKGKLVYKIPSLEAVRKYAQSLGFKVRKQALQKDYAIHLPKAATLFGSCE